MNIAISSGGAAALCARAPGGAGAMVSLCATNLQPIYRAPLWLRGSAANAPLELTCAMMRSSRYHICKIRSPCAAGAYHRDSVARSHTLGAGGIHVASIGADLLDETPSLVWLGLPNAAFFSWSALAVQMLSIEILVLYRVTSICSMMGLVLYGLGSQSLRFSVGPLSRRRPRR